MVRKKPRWTPTVGALATYIGRSAGKTRNVRILAEASNQRIFVEAMGGNGLPVRFTVKRKNLVPLQPGLFDPDPAPDSPDPSA